jgi:hypothetical protein
MANTEFVAYETSSQDICYDGTHNQTRVDEFAHRCTLRLTRFYGFDDSFRDKMIEFEHRVLAAGWDRGRWDGPMENYMTNYYDVRHLRNNPSMAVNSLNVVQRYFTVPFFEQLNLREGNEVLEQVTRVHKYVLAVAIHGNYFRD